MTLFLGLWTLGSASTASPAAKTVKTDAIAQGVNAAVQVHPASGAKSPPDKAIRKAFDEAKRLYKDLDQKSSGELGRINKGAGKEKVKVSGAMLTLLRVCMQISEWTHGLFDVVQTSGKKTATLQVDFGRGEVQLEKKAWVDFSGIRNGYVVDRMAGTLKSEGYGDFMIQSGPVFRTMGRDGQDYWRLNVADPNGSGKGLCRVSLEASSIATADTRLFPNSRTDLQSVTVIARNATNASALAKAGLFSGRENARTMFASIPEPGFGVILEDRNGKIHIVGDVTAACFQE
ncbi:MAG TPA: FAD:protein FMN transferase [bacterium]|nr:FAD:protein FMN transferase [bacterium]